MLSTKRYPWLLLQEFAFLYSAFLGSAACPKITLGQKFAYLVSVQAGFFNILNYVLKRLNSSIPFDVVKWTETVFNCTVKRKSFLNIMKSTSQNLGHMWTSVCKYEQSKIWHKYLFYSKIGKFETVKYMKLPVRCKIPLI